MLRRDVIHAVRSLAKEKAFTLVCVLSLGIGMGAFVALVTFSRAITAPARGINTAGWTELLVLPQGRFAPKPVFGRSSAGRIRTIRRCAMPTSA
jgi:hypothetical protein